MKYTVTPFCICTFTSVNRSALIFFVCAVRLSELDGPGFESHWGEIFRSCPDRPDAHPASCTMGTRSFAWLKRPERDADRPPASSANVASGL
jgi:hypothetical protein